MFSRLGVAWRGRKVSKRMSIDLIASAVGVEIPCVKVRWRRVQLSEGLSGSWFG